MNTKLDDLSRKSPQFLHNKNPSQSGASNKLPECEPLNEQPLNGHLTLVNESSRWLVSLSAKVSPLRKGSRHFLHHHHKRRTRTRIRWMSVESKDLQEEEEEYEFEEVVCGFRNQLSNNQHLNLRKEQKASKSFNIPVNLSRCSSECHSSSRSKNRRRRGRGRDTSSCAKIKSSISIYSPLFLLFFLIFPLQLSSASPSSSPSQSSFRRHHQQSHRQHQPQVAVESHAFESENLRFARELARGSEASQGSAPSMSHHEVPYTTCEYSISFYPQQPHDIIDNT